MGDIIEHLREPEQVMRKAAAWLRPGGAVLLSTPNVGHISIIEGLLSGHWTYEASGILDRTHLKFFTLSELEKLARTAGLALESAISWVLTETGSEQALKEKLVALGVPADQLDAYQYKVCLRK